MQVSALEYWNNQTRLTCFFSRVGLYRKSNRQMRSRSQQLECGDRSLNTFLPTRAIVYIYIARVWRNMINDRSPHSNCWLLDRVWRWDLLNVRSHARSSSQKVVCVSIVTYLPIHRSHVYIAINTNFIQYTWRNSIADFMRVTCHYSGWYQCQCTTSLTQIRELPAHNAHCLITGSAA